MTDIMSSFLPQSSIGIFLNKKVRDLFLSYDMRGGRFYESTFKSNNPKITKEQLNNYYFLHLIEYLQIIDFKKSEFKDLKTETIIKVEKEEELPIFSIPQKLVLKEIPDLLRSPFKVDILVSESLKLEMEKLNVTGVLFEKYSWNEFYK